MVTVIPPAWLKSCMIPHVYCKSEAFEAYVCNTFFPKEKFVLIRRSENQLQPVFTFHELSTGFEFSVECIFRLGFIANSFQQTEGIDKRAAHFLIFGLGGAANVPTQIFLINTATCGRTILSKRHLRGKNINPHSAVSSSQLWEKNMIPNYVGKKVA